MHKIAFILNFMQKNKFNFYLKNNKFNLRKKNMKIIRKLAIPMPLTLEQYTKGYRYIICKISLEETEASKADSIKISLLESKKAENEEFGSCKFTKKLIDVSPKIPSIIKAVVPKKSLLITESSFNNFQKCRTNYLSEYFSDKKFSIQVDSLITNCDNFEKKFVKTKTETEVFLNDDIFFIDIRKDDKENKIDLKQKLEENWYQNGEVLVVEKTINVNIGIFGIGSFAKDVIKEYQVQFFEQNKKIFNTKEIWENMSDEEILKLEKSVDDSLRN